MTTMKKFIPILITIAGFLWGSCTNDAILIEADNYYNLALQINTEKLYDDFTIKNSIQNQVLSLQTALEVGVVTLVYDANGNLVDSVCTYQRTLTQARQDMNLKEGDYTLISFETVIDPSNRYQSLYWELKDIAKLSTAHIETRYDEVYFDAVIGLHTQQVSLHKDETVSVVPAPVGSLVHIDYYNLNATNCDFVGFLTKNSYYGVKLDTSIPRANRYMARDYTGSGVWRPRATKTNPGGHLDEKFRQTIYILEEGNVNWCFAPSVIGPNGEVNFTEGYPSLNTFHNFQIGSYLYAGLFYTGSGFEAFMGSQEAFKAWESTMEFNPQPVNTKLYELPCMVWGSNKDAVKTYMAAYTLNKDYALNSEGNFYYMQYRGKDKEFLIEYRFSSQDQGLTDAIVVLRNVSDITRADIEAFIQAQGYTYTDYDEAGGIYNYTKEGTSVMLYSQNGDWIIQYYDPRT